MAARTLTEHLLGKGYRKFGYLGWNSNDFAAATRFKTVMSCLQEHGVQLFAPDIFDGPSGAPDGKRGLQVLLGEYDPDDVMFSNDIAATGALIHCLEKGIPVPEELAIAGFSGLASAQALARPLTRNKTPRYQIGRRAAGVIPNRLGGTEYEPRMDLGFRLLEGSTS